MLAPGALLLATSYGSGGLCYWQLLTAPRALLLAGVDAAVADMAKAVEGTPIEGRVEDGSRDILASQGASQDLPTSY